jgi:hypothetical protein
MNPGKTPSRRWGSAADCFLYRGRRILGEDPDA